LPDASPPFGLLAPTFLAVAVKIMPARGEKSVRLFKALVWVEGNSQLLTCPAIEWESRVWLVPRWIEMPSEGYGKPERLILMEQFQHQKIPDGNPADFAVNVPIPRDLFDADPIPPEAKARYVVVEKPDIKLRLSTLH
jgi:hypothetical protein